MVGATEFVERAVERHPGCAKPGKEMNVGSLASSILVVATVRP